MLWNIENSYDHNLQMNQTWALNNASGVDVPLNKWIKLNRLY